jgi:hypothetical protein
MTVDADELVLVSVDDHICEPANMFDAHVPARDIAIARRASSTNPTGPSSGITASCAAGTSA